MSAVPSITLNDGVAIPQLGYGVFQVPPAEAQQAVEAALEAGYRHIDTAAAYRNEEGVGAAVRASGLPREQVFVTTKLANVDQGTESARAAFRDSMAALNIGYIDLYLIHWPSPARGTYVQTWKVLEELVATDELRSIGVSNFLPEHLDKLAAEADVVPSVNQIELHPYLQQREMAARSRAAGIAVEAYSPLGRTSVLSDPELVRIADGHGVSPAQAVLRWQIQQGNITIPKTVSPARMAENFDIFGFELSADEGAAIDGLERGAREGANPATAEFDQK